jgi:hypothetical protein
MSGRIVFFAAVVLLTFGILFLASQQGWINFEGFISTWWPVVLIAAGLGALLDRQGGWSAWLLFAVGAVLLLANLHILPRSRVMRLWPLALVMVGLSFVTGMRRRR